MRPNERRDLSVQIRGPHMENGGRRRGQRTLPPARARAFLLSLPQTSVKGMTPDPLTSIPGP